MSLNTANESVVTLAALGDILLHGSYHAIAARGDGASLFSELESLLEDCDLAVGNMETVLTNSGTPRDDKLCLDGDPCYAEVLCQAGVNLMTLANNHCLDFGIQGLLDTQRNLNSAGVGFFGAGMDLIEARRPWITEVNGIRIGFIAACHGSTKPAAMAADGTPGVAPLSEQTLLEDIGTLKPQVDHVIVVLHWGLEYSHYPTPEQVQLAHSAIDQGASAIIGHHSHSIQGIETYGSGIIAYSLANLTDAPVDWQGPNRHYQCDLTEVDRESLLIKFRLTHDQIELVQSIPLWLDDRGAPTPAEGQRAQRIRASLAQYSAKIADGNLDAYWQETVVGSRVAGPLISWWNDGSLWDKIRRFRPGQLVTAWLLLRTWVQLRFSRSESKWELFNARNDSRPMPSAERGRTNNG